MTLYELISNYGFLVVFSGLLSSLICGALKIPLVRCIKSKNLGEKETAKRITASCISIVAILSIIFVVLFRCYEVHSFAPFASITLYQEIFSSIAFSQIAYKLYEGVGSVSIKNFLHSLWEKRFSITKDEEDGDALDLAQYVQDVLESKIHLPLTDDQMKQLIEEISKTYGTKGS